MWSFCNAVIAFSLCPGFQALAQNECLDGQACHAAAQTEGSSMLQAKQESNHVALEQMHQDESNKERMSHRIKRAQGCSVTSTIVLPRWLSIFVGLLTDVDLYCDFPSEDDVLSKIKNIESSIVKRKASIVLKPSEKIVFKEVPADKTGEDLKEALKADKDMESLKEDHVDSCHGDPSWPAVATAKEIYDNIKSMVDSFDIFSKCTKVYIAKDATGKAQIAKDDVMAISTLLAFGHYSLSYEDIAHYDEVVDGENRTLSVVVSSRKENVIEGNYDITVALRDDEVTLTYTKRQNFAESLLSSQCDDNCYKVATQQSVDLTILKLAYAGVYGTAAISFDNTGCRKDTSTCKGYSTKKIEDTCKDHEECSSDCCQRPKWHSWNKECVASSECD